MSPASAGCADLFVHRVGERDGLVLEFEATALAYARPLLNAIDGDDVKFRVLLANLERGLKFGRIAPTLQRLRAFPPKDHDRPVREVARDPRSRSCRDILAAVIFDRFLSRRNVLLRVARLVADLVDGDHIDGRFGLRMQSLDGGATKHRPARIDIAMVDRVFMMVLQWE